MTTIDIQAVIKALDSGNYEVSIVRPRGIKLCDNYRGEPFLRLIGRATDPIVSAGACRVKVLGHVLVCDLNTGNWSCEGESLEAQLVSVLESSKGITSGSHSDGVSWRQLFARMHNLPDDIPYCWSEDGNWKDSEEFGWDKVQVKVMYRASGTTQWNAGYFSVNDALMLSVYEGLERLGKLPEGDGVVRVDQELIKDIASNLYEVLWDEIDTLLDGTGTDYEFYMDISWKELDRVLL